MERTSLGFSLPTAEKGPSRNAGGSPPLSDPVREYCETLLSRLLWSEDASALRLRMLGVTSCYRGEGVSTVASQLAVAGATAGGLPVLLVDANLARPVVHRTFAVSPSPGWSDVLGDPRQVNVAIRPSGVKNLSVLPAGTPDRRNWSYEGSGLGDVLKAIRTEFELVIVDLPPVGQTSAAMRLAGWMDGVLLVVEAERVRYEVAQRTRELLGRSNVHLLGAVLNKRRQYVPNWLYRTL